MKSWSVYPIRFLLVALCEKFEGLSQQEKASAGVVARNLLEFALAQSPRDEVLIRSGIETVCRTYETAPFASKSLLSRILAAKNLKEFGYQDIPALAREVQNLVKPAADFVRDLYVSAFGFKEGSNQQTAMGPGRILPLTSNRRQDYNHGLWQLGESFPAFLRALPALAVEALVASVTSSIGRLDNAAEQQFEFRGIAAWIVSDRSHRWDSTPHRHEVHLKMLDAFEAELNRLALDQNLIAAENSILSAVAQKNRFASLWRKVLVSGARNPTTLGKRIAMLGCAVPILTCVDTSDLAGNFIKAIYTEITVDERTSIENAILSIPNSVAAGRRDSATKIRDRLLRCIPPDFACVQEVKTIIAQSCSKGGAPPKVPPSFSEDSETQFFANQGVPITAEPNDKIVELAEPLKAFAANHSQHAPILPEILPLVPVAQALQIRLRSAQNDVTHEQQIENGWTHLMSFCKCAARCEALSCTADEGLVIRNLLLKGGKHPSPNSGWDWAGFDSNPSWSPAPRIEAAEGLMFLALKPDCMGDRVLQEIKRLSKDQVPPVRMQIADHLDVLQKTSPETFNELLSQIAEHDSSSTVVLSLLNYQIHRIAPQRPEEAGRLAALIYGRNDLEGENAAETRLSCVSLFLNIFLWKSHRESEQLLGELANDALKYTDEATRLVSNIHEILVRGPIEPPDPVVETARSRAFAILEAIVSSAQSGFFSLNQKNNKGPFRNWPSKDQSKAQALAQLADSAAMQLYFASGAFDSKANEGQGRPVSKEQKRRLLKEAGPLMDLLSKDPHPSTVHHLIQMLQFLLDISPREVFLRISRIVNGGKRGGYERESLAISEIVNVVNRMFADFRPLLQADAQMRQAMVSILDTFVEAGWSQAIQLTYRLDEIFR